MNPGSSGPDLRACLDFDDERLLAECEVHTYRASGPGGQHRNKTSSAIRLHHRPSGLTAKGAESRSQHENKARALRRLRETLAVSVRRPLPDPPPWPAGVQIIEGTLRVSERNPNVPHVLALVLDALADSGAQLADAAGRLGITPSSLARFLAAHHAAWAEANRLRQQAGLPPLRA